EDDLLTAYNQAATDAISAALDLQLMQATYRLDLPGFWVWEPVSGTGYFPFTAYDGWNSAGPWYTGLPLPYPPLQSVSQIDYLDVAGVRRTLPASAYEVITNPRPGLVRQAPLGPGWPGTTLAADAVRITYVAGFPSDQLPAPAKQAIMLLVNHWFMNRE